MGADPEGGSLFLFFNRSVDRVKALWWDHNGFCLFYKRLERGRFRVPQPLNVGAASVEIDGREMEQIFRGVTLSKKKMMR